MSRFEKILLHLSTAFTALSGLVYFWMKYLKGPADPWSALRHPWQPHLLALHLLAAPFLVFAIGLITREHVVGNLREGRLQRGRASGVVTFALGAPMIATGYLMQVLNDPRPRRVLLIAHLASGILFTVLLGAHAVAARPGRRPPARGRGRGGRGNAPRRGLIGPKIAV